MTLYFDPDGTVAGLADCLQQATAGSANISGLLILCCDANNFAAEALDPLLRQVSLPLAGGIFPSIIHAGKVHERGTLVIGLPEVVTIQAVHSLSDDATDYEHLLQEKVSDSSRVRTLILLVDGFATRLAAFIESLFNVFGLEFNYVGGGAGSLSMVRKPCILTNNGLVTDAAVLVFLETASGIGVCHGWQELAGPFQVTGAKNSAVQTIEMQPAYDFYCQVLAEKAGRRVNREAFYDTAKDFPFGIARLGGEQIVRDPFLVQPDGSLVCVGEIQEGAFISILHADEASLIEAASESLRLSLRNLPSREIGGLRFFVDCVSRMIVLRENFQKEIDAVSQGAQPLVGICSIGEIANSGTEYLELYNKTSVMAVLARK